MSAYEPEWLERMASVDWLPEAGRDDARTPQLDRGDWVAWRRDLAEVILDLDDEELVTVAGPPLDRPFPARPPERLLKRAWDGFRGKGRFWPTIEPREIERLGFDPRLVPVVQIFRSAGTLSATLPCNPPNRGWFPWTDDELDVIVGAGWRPAALEPFENPDLLHWPGSAAPIGGEAGGARRRPAEEVSELTVAVFHRALGLPTPAPVRVVRLG